MKYVVTFMLVLHPISSIVVKLYPSLSPSSSNQSDIAQRLCQSSARLVGINAKIMNKEEIKNIVTFHQTTSDIRRINLLLSSHRLCPVSIRRKALPQQPMKELRKSIEFNRIPLSLQQKYTA